MSRLTSGVVEAVVFDLDGVLVDSEQAWDATRRQIVTELGGQWRRDATRTMMGMSSTEWSSYLHDELSVRLPPQEIIPLVVERMTAVYRQRLPLIPGATAAVSRMAERWPLGVASSSNRELIDLVLDLAGIRKRFVATVSSEEVTRGKPAPDVYLEVMRRLEVPADRGVAVEDSTNGILAAKAAGMRVIAIPNRALAPEPDALSVADRVVVSLNRLTAETVAGLPDR